MKIMLSKSILAVTFLLPLFLSLHAQSFSVRKVGHGKQVILFIPGFACSGEVWSQTVDTLRRNYTCYILTMPGFAGTAPEKTPSFMAWVKQITEFIRKEKLKQPIVVGHSMGGGLALAMASRYPNLIKSVVIVDALPCLAAVYSADFQSRKITADEFAQAENKLLRMSDAEVCRQAYMNAVSLTTDTLRVQRLVEWSLTSDRKTYAKMFIDYTNIDLRADVLRYTVPTLVLLEHPFKRIASVIEPQFGNSPAFSIRYADKGLHFIMFDNWEWYIKQLREFLNKQL